MMKGRSTETRRLCDVRQLVVLQALDVILLHEGIDILLDIGNLGWEAMLDLGDDFFDEVDMLELLAALHDSDNDGLG
jgi:hypothetical protein